MNSKHRKTVVDDANKLPDLQQGESLVDYCRKIERAVGRSFEPNVPADDMHRLMKDRERDQLNLELLNKLLDKDRQLGLERERVQALMDTGNRMASELDKSTSLMDAAGQEIKQLRGALAEGKAIVEKQGKAFLALRAEKDRLEADYKAYYARVQEANAEIAQLQARLAEGMDQETTQARHPVVLVAFWVSVVLFSLLAGVAVSWSLWAR